MNSKLSILQWNCQGLKSKYESLRILIKEHFPIILSLQETMLGQRKLCPRGYFMYHNEVHPNETHGGSALLLRQDVIHNEIHLQTNLQAVAVQVHLKRTYTICSLYLPPNRPDQNLKQDLDDLLDQLPQPFMVLGDFNGRHPMWGDVMSNSRGNLIFSIIEDRELAVLNTGAPTHFHVQTGSLTSIDISLCTPDCFLDFSWEIMDEGIGSDHFPIMISLVDEIAAPRSPRWLIDKANWALFAILTALQVEAEEFPSIEEALEFLNKVIIDASNKSIPRTTGHFSRKPVPWWNIQCQVTRKAMRAAFTRYLRHPYNYYLVSYKKARAKFRYQVKQAKQSVLG